MNNRLSSIFFIVCCCLNTFIVADSSWTAPTQRFLASEPLEEVKYNLRLDNVTFEHKPLFDKAVAQETAGFFGYYGASGDFRVYQDLIRMVFEEVLNVSISPDFHFIAVPLYPERTIHNLEQVPEAFFGSQAKIVTLKNQFFPIQLSLYSNHNTLGLCPVRNFYLGTKYTHVQDLKWLFAKLGLDSNIIEKALSIGTTYFEPENRILLQFFDASHQLELENYQMIDKNCYPASPSGHPFQNHAVSDYALNCVSKFPPQMNILLNDQVLNPNTSLVIKRYMKVSPSKIKAYETEIRSLIKNTSYDAEECSNYINQLRKAWEK